MSYEWSSSRCSNIWHAVAQGFRVVSLDMGAHMGTLLCECPSPMWPAMRLSHAPKAC